jgi:preprotein translocase subunit SecG
MEQFLIILQVIFAVILISLILIQQGKGADAGASFGGGSSNTMFGAQGSFSFLFKLTAFIAFLFFANSIAITHYFVGNINKSKKPHLTSTNTGAGGVGGAHVKKQIKTQGKVTSEKSKK